MPLMLIALLVPLVTALTGCASAPPLPLEKQKEYALLLPRENNSTMISMIDGVGHGSLSGKGVDVLPGERSIAIATCFGSANNCATRYYKFYAEAGLEYRFVSTNSIDVYSRFEPTNLVDKLVAYRGTFSSSTKVQQEVAKRQQAELEAKAAIDLATNERRKRDLPSVRKIGARICQERQGVDYIGFVESLASEKVQIRISNAFFKSNPNIIPGGFVPSIVWDSPLHWDLCE